jgi:hypothetical protein
LLEALADAMGFGCCEQANVYDVYDGAAPPADRSRPGDAAHIFMIQEEGKDCQGVCCRVCFNPFHAMTLAVTDAKDKQPVFKIDRPFKWCGCACCPCGCCHQQWNVINTNGGTIGRVQQRCCGGGCFPKFHLYDGAPNDDNDDYNTEADYWLTGPHFIGELCCDVNFDLKNPRQTDAEGKPLIVGNITKLGATNVMDAVAEALTDADKFSFTIPKEASVTAKATAITSLVLLDYYFFESGGAIECNPMAAPGEPCLTINCCTEYCCGMLYPWTMSFSKGE